MLCVIGIGSNVQPRKHIRLAIQLLRQEFGELKVSNAYHSCSVLFEGNDFINMVALIDTKIKLPQLSSIIKKIEQKIDPNNQPLENRKIDLDLLLYGSLCSKEYNIPRSDILKFSFVSCTLSEVLPDGKHPQSGQRYVSLCEQLKNSPVLTKLENFI